MATKVIPYAQVVLNGGYVHTHTQPVAYEGQVKGESSTSSRHAYNIRTSTMCVAVV